jgi:hypothetical protein
MALNRDEKLHLLATKKNIIVDKGFLKSPLENFFQPLDVSRLIYSKVHWNVLNIELKKNI